MGESSVRYHYHLLLPDPVDRRVLLLESENGLVFPHWQSIEPHYWQSVTHINCAARERFGVDVTTLRCLKTVYDRSANCVSSFYEQENRGGAVPVQGGRWCGKEDLAAIAVPEERAMLVSWFEEAEYGRPDRRPDWSRPDWFDRVRLWIDGQLQMAGQESVGALEQVRTWERGCVLRVPATAGDLYFKALPSMFAHEIPLVALLHMLCPYNTLTLLAVDTRHAWMLMEDIGGESLDRIADPRVWEECLMHFARLQLKAAQCLGDLIALGCPDRRVDGLATQIDSFFVVLESYPGLTDQDIEQLRALAPRLVHTCKELGASPVPASLEHGDFWPGNVAVRGSSSIFFDWTDSSVSHPFFSVALFFELGDASCVLPLTDDLVFALRDAYLSEWLEYGSLERLRAIYALARQVAPLHAALIYHRTILPGMEARWEMENMVSFYLRMLLTGGAAPQP